MVGDLAISNENQGAFVSNAERRSPKQLIHVEISEITSELRAFVRGRFAIPEDDPDFNDEIDLFNYGYIDSFGAVDLISFIANRFSVQLTDSDWAASPMNTIREISSFVAKRHKGEL